jgi:hypothetical protein
MNVPNNGEYVDLRDLGIDLELETNFTLFI